MRLISVYWILDCKFNLRQINKCVDLLGCLRFVSLVLKIVLQIILSISHSGHFL